MYDEDFDLARDIGAGEFGGRPLFCDLLVGESCSFGTDSTPFDIIDGLDASEGGADTSVALGEPGIGASWTLITFWRFEVVG